MVDATDLKSLTERCPGSSPGPRTIAPLSGDFPTHDAARRIALAVKRLGFRLSRDAAGPGSKSAYVYVHRGRGLKSIKVRISDHAASRGLPDIDVHVGVPREGAVPWEEAIRQIGLYSQKSP